MLAEIFEWIWTTFGKDIAKFSTKRAWKKFEFHKAAEKYTKEMQRKHGFIRILDMTTPLSLEGMFTHVNVLSTPSTFRRGKKEQLQDIFLGRTTYGETVEQGKDALQAIRQYDKLFILGKPGSGKTTLLKYFVLQALQGKLNRFPIFIPLRWFSESGQSLFEFITVLFKNCDFPDTKPFINTLLQNGKAIILCDGLDEVNTQEGARNQIIKELVNFSYRYGENQYVITCRVAASEYSFEAFTPVEIADFEKDQIHAFVKNWFAYSSSIDGIANRLLDSSVNTAERFIEEFEKQNNPRLYDLAKNPLILTLLCIAYEMTLEFPQRRSEIYEEALSLLLAKWDASRNIKRDEVYRQLTLGRKRQMFAHIAAETFEKNEYLFEQREIEKRIVDYLQHVPQTDPAEDIDGEAILKAIEAQHGIFVEQAKGIHSFSHLTFQEFYTAQYIVNNAQKKGVLEGLIQHHCTEDNWREVFLLTAEMLYDADEFFEVFLNLLDEMVRQNTELKTLLSMVEREANDLQSDATPFVKRWAILALILDLNLSLAHVRPHARVLDYPLGCIRALALDQTLVFGHVRALGHALGHVHELALSIVRIHNFDHVRAHIHIHICYKKAIELSRQEGLDKLYDALEGLSIPSKEDSAEIWKAFANTLFGILQDHLPVKDYTLTEEQAKHIANYLTATELLICCLNNAYVSDREAIKEQLFRIPSH